MLFMLASAFIAELALNTGNILHDFLKMYELVFFVVYWTLIVTVQVSALQCHNCNSTAGDCNSGTCTTSVGGYCATAKTTVINVKSVPPMIIKMCLSRDNVRSTFQLINDLPPNSYNCTTISIPIVNGTIPTNICVCNTKNYCGVLFVNQGQTNSNSWLTWVFILVVVLKVI